MIPSKKSIQHVYEFDELQRFDKKNKEIIKGDNNFSQYYPIELSRKLQDHRETPVTSSIKNLARKRRRNPEISRIEFLGSTGGGISARNLPYCTNRETRANWSKWKNLFHVRKQWCS